MSLRATWRGSIRISLVTVPIRVFPATTSASDVSFRQLHRVCQTPIQYKKWCPHCDQEVTADEIVKGHEAAKGEYVIVEDEEIRKLRPETTHVIDVSHVLDAGAIDPIYVERVYFLAPDNKPAAASYAVLREGLQGRAAVGRLAVHGREYLAALVAREQAIAMYTLRTAGEVRGLDAISELEDVPGKVKPEEVRLARQVLEHFESNANLSEFTDNYQTALKKLLEARRPTVLAAAPADGKTGRPAKVVNLMDALRKSLETIERPQSRRKPAVARAVLKHPGSRRRKAG
jgi:DNA end-binding protein Ku